MKVKYNVTGNERKALVKVISDTTGAKAVYRFMPTCNFDIDYFTVTKDGTLIFDDMADSEEVKAVLEAIASAGFEPEPAEEAAPAATEADSGEETTPAEDGDQLTISFPKDGFTEGSIENLRKLVESKATLIMKALGADRITIDTDGDRVEFPWWDRQPEYEETQSYMAFLAALCKMAKEAKRVTAKETEVESEKYAFRCFLLRLGFIGNDYKPQRKILMRRLSGSAAFPNKEKADAFSAAQKAKAAKEVAACE